MSEAVKTCTKCGNEYPATIEHFNRAPNGRFGLASVCKECRAVYRRKRRAANHDQMLAREAEYREANRESIRAASRKYLDAHPEKKNAWNKANPEKARENNRKWCEANREKINARHREIYAADIEKARERNREWAEANPEKVKEMRRRYRETHRAEETKYRETHKEETREYGIKYRESHKEEIKERDRAYREANRERIKEYRRQYREANLDKFKRKDRAYYQSTREERLEYQRRYNKDHPDAGREWHRKAKQDPEKWQRHLENKHNQYLRAMARDPERMRSNQRKWHHRQMQMNPEYRAIIAERNRRHRSYPKNHLSGSLGHAIGRSLRGDKDGRPWESLVGYTTEELMTHLESQFTRGMTWENYGDWHIDHIKPISHFHFETTDDPEFHECWSLWNLQPLWAKDNIRKNARCEQPPLPLLHQGAMNDARP